MPLAPRTLLLAALLLGLTALAPIVIASYGVFLIGASGCVLPTNEPKPAVECDVEIVQRDRTTQTEIRLTRLIDYGFFALITLPLAGTPAIALGAIALWRGVQKWRSARKK